jgi:DNA-binding beta-propeller fold protein YncE
MKPSLPLIAAIGVFATFTSAAWSDQIAREVHLPGTDRWDYLSVDERAERVYVSHGSHVDVLDARTLTPVGKIDATPGVHGIAIAPDLGRGYISAGASDTVVVFALDTLARVAEIKTTGANPDAILYEPNTQRVFTFNGRGHNATAIDAKTNRVLGTIELQAKPEFAVANAAGHIFVNLEDTSSIAEIDARALAVRARWPLKGCDEPSGLALDRAQSRLFSVCSNAVMEIVDATTGRLVTQMPIGKNVDGAGFDPVRRLAFASSGDGMLSVIKEDGADKFSAEPTIKTALGARTMAVDTQTHRIFVSAGVRQPGTPVTIKEGSFEVIAIDP